MAIVKKAEKNPFNKDGKNRLNLKDSVKNK